MIQDDGKHPTSRRDLLKASATWAVAGVAGAATSGVAAAEQEQKTVKNGRIKQTVCKWCYKDLSLDEMALVATKLGLVGVDLVDPEDFPILQKHHLVCTMTTSPRHRQRAQRSRQSRYVPGSN